MSGALAELPAQEPPDDQAARITNRIRALQKEAEGLAGQSRSLVGDLRKREIDREVKAAELEQAEAEARQAEQALKESTDRLSELELQRINQLPDVTAQLVDVYKRGHTGYLRLLFGATNVREFARAARAVGALSAVSEQRIADHRRTIDELRAQRAEFERRANERRARVTRARRARASSDAALASVTELITQIDSRRDLTAQYVGELQVAYNRMQQQIASLADQPESSTGVPLRPFQGALEWPVTGPIVGPFGQPSNRLGGSVAKNGIEISTKEDAPVRAIHGGAVGFAGPFAGFGTLVILDHGADTYSLYGYLASTSLEQGQTVASGAEVGRVGLAPAGPPTLYFEMRIDGRSVNPVQWLKPR